jgi:hypothetical protein
LLRRKRDQHLRRERRDQAHGALDQRDAVDFEERLVHAAEALA